jgi:hypothetical protein
MNGQADSLIKPRVAPIGRGADWLFEGFGYFKKSALPWMGAFLLLFVITVASGFVPLIGSLAMQLLLPVFFAGLILGCHAQAQGGEFNVTHLFAGFSKNTARLIILGILYLVGVILILVLLVIVIFILPGGTALLEKIQVGDTEVIRQSLKLIILVTLIGMAIYLPLLMAFWFAPTLVVLNNVSPMTALRLSFMGCLVNILPFTVYGLLALVFFVLAIIPLMLGLLIVGPMITASIYVSWRDIFQ